MSGPVPRPEFPRPDFERADWVNLNGEWEFSFTDPVFDRTILVPFCYQAVKSGIGDETDYPVVWYRRSFCANGEKLQTKRLLLKFGAVDYRAEVYLNGCLVGSHTGGHTPFEMDITDIVEPGENTLMVRCEDGLETDKPRGKQGWKGRLFGCWYTPTTGIWQSVWLEYAGRVYAKRVKITPDIHTMTALCEVYVSSLAPVQVTLSPVLEHYKGNKTPLDGLAITCKNGYGRGVLVLPLVDFRRGEVCWHPDHPNLIGVNLAVHSPEGAPDEVYTYFGMRSVQAKGDGIYLNGRLLYQRLVLDQGYWPETLMTPPSDEAIQKDLRLTKALGFNGARKHQKIEDPRYYYWADKTGVLVWGELPSAYMFNDAAVTSSVAELTEFVQRDYNHPCIITWVPLNESWGVMGIADDVQIQNYARMLLYSLKAQDKTRLVSGNDGWEQPAETDICALHDYRLFANNTGKYDDLQQVVAATADKRVAYADGNAHSGQPFILSEYGGVAFDDGNDDGWGYNAKVQTAEEFLQRVAPVTRYIIRHPGMAGYCYTQLTDVMQEVNGLLKPDRSPKLPLAQLAAVFAEPREGQQTGEVQP